MMMNKFHKQQNQKGFTLIELLIVVAIIGILAAIAIPQFAQYRVRAFNSAAQNDLRTARTSLEGHYTDTFAYPVIADETTDGSEGESTLRIPGLVIPLSARVASIYDGTGQWFAIGMSHIGGDRQFATAQDASVNYYITKITGADPVWTALPGAYVDGNADDDDLDPTPDTRWEDGDWNQL